MNSLLELPEERQIAGERIRRQVDFTPWLADGDHLVSAGLTATATLMRGFEAEGTGATITGTALATGDSPASVAFLVEATAPDCDYRIDVTASTATGERKTIPLMLKVLR